MLYAIEGNHPSTGNQWRFFQAINFTYIPRTVRRRFIREWINILEASNGNTKFTWEKVKARYPYIKYAVRRYFYSPNYYITKLKEVPVDDLERVVVSSFSRDFSKKVKVSLINKFRDVMRKRGRKR